MLLVKREHYPIPTVEEIMRLFICPLILFHLICFLLFYLLIYWWMPASSIYIHPSIHSSCASVRPSRPSICLPPTHAPTYPQLIIYRFCIHKNKFFWFNHCLILSCMSPSSSASLRTFINSSLLVKSYLGQYGHIVPQLNEFRSIRLIFFSFTLCMRSEERNSNWRWTRRFVRANPWPLEKAWASASIQWSRVARL